MTRQLTVHTAEITTAAVQIKTLTVTGKQVTLAVFRQLEERPLIATDGSLNGLPWGRVNYHPDKCGDMNKHWHVVWQDGTDLRRARVAVELAVPDAIQTQEGNKFLDAVIAEHLADGETRWFCGKSPWLKESREGYDYLSSASIYDCVVCDSSLFQPWHAELTISSAACAAIVAENELRRWERDGVKDWQHRYVAEHQRTLDKFRNDVASYNATVDALFGEYRKAAQAEVERRVRHRQVRAALADLPQLFIAV